MPLLRKGSRSVMNAVLNLPTEELEKKFMPTFMPGDEHWWKAFGFKVAGGQKIEAHKVVLTSLSPYLHGLLTSGLAESAAQSQELTLEGGELPLANRASPTIFRSRKGRACFFSAISVFF